MSAGSFSLSKYESDLDLVHEIKLQPETIEATIGGAANDPPAAAVSSPFAAEVNRGAKSYGLKPRRIRVTFTDNPPTGYRPYTKLTLPILTKDLFASISGGDEVSYNGGTGEVTKKIPENILPGQAALGQDNDEPETPV